ncbi:D-hexose-6-phosphate mutarotase [Solimonas marina]|uniref:Putative glucose-6-phosphate 1-epimerase n=1 Tax=Solimonas marina TaxID=2714601 RepID=A0A969W6E7_9GAMM|nr:D-hexose-6-phosphate mutarotase [Solimonas marina]NKF21506.1 D-hexose-6-phosphate mutarotase [Solimonas marina]
MEFKAATAPYADVTIDSVDGAQATLSRHGAHVVSWQAAGGGEQLYLSSKAQAGAGQAIRGGIPVIFPQFAAEGPLPKHGVARTGTWTLSSRGRDADGRGRAIFTLADSADTRAVWPYAFLAALHVTVGGASLDVELRIHNRDDAPFTFTAALHTYLRVDDIDHARLSSLQGLHYRDSAHGNTACIETDDPLAIVGEVDRIYFDTPPAVELRDGRRTLRIGQRGFTDLVVWNPGAEKADALTDLDADGWRQMLCVEAAVIGVPVTLDPGAQWSAAQTLEVL